MTEPDYKAWLERIKAGTATEKDYQDVFSISHKRPLSALITDTDADWLIELGQSQDFLKRSCAWTLMRYIASLPAIQQCLRTAWDRADLSDEERSALLWRVLDDPDLPTEVHQKIWNWIKINRSIFISGLLDYLAPYMRREGKTLNQILEDYASGPPSKRWVYVAATILGADTADSKSDAAELLDRSLEALPGTYLAIIESELRKLLKEGDTP